MLRGRIQSSVEEKIVKNQDVGRVILALALMAGCSWGAVAMVSANAKLDSSNPLSQNEVAALQDRGGTLRQSNPDCKYPPCD
jgi:hypothetical protein